MPLTVVASKWTELVAFATKLNALFVPSGHTLELAVKVVWLTDHPLLKFSLKGKRFVDCG